MDREYRNALKDLEIAKQTYQEFKGTKREKSAEAEVNRLKGEVKYLGMALDLQRAIVGIHPQAGILRKLIKSLKTGKPGARESAYLKAQEIQL